MIVPMKKAQIVVLKEDKEKVLKNLQKSAVMMLISSEEKEITADISFENETLKKVEESVKILNNYTEKKGLVREEFIVDYETFTSKNPRRLELLELTKEANQRISDLKAENESLKAEVSFYLPWKNLTIKLDEIDSPKLAKINLGFVPASKVDGALELISEYGGDFEVLYSQGSETAVIFSCYIDDEASLLKDLTNLGFSKVSLPKLPLTTSEIIDEKETKIKENLSEIEKLNQDLKDYSNEIKEILLLADKLESEKVLKTAPVNETHSAVYLVGWVRSDQLDLLKKAVAKATPDYDLAIMDPEEGEVVPTALKNNKFVSAFEPITEMFSIPSINDVDPNPIMGFWYWLIFGMMMGDAGYGVVLAILMALLIKLTKPKGTTYKMFKMFYYGAFATIFWGIMFSSYFGYQLHKPILLNPQIDIMKYLVVSIIVGALHIISGFLVKAYGDFKDGRFVDAIFDNFAWVFFLMGIGLYFIPNEMVSKVGLALAITGVVLIVFTHGRKNKNIFAKLGGGLYSLYNSVNIFSDILSYSRILALSLSSAIIGMVMNTLAELFTQNPSVFGIIIAAVIYIIGHAFNLAMGLLSAYVHDSRLQYIEFFSKFYEGGGVQFKPLSMNLKHIDKIEKVEI